MITRSVLYIYLHDDKSREVGYVFQTKLQLNYYINYTIFYNNNTKRKYGYYCAVAPLFIYIMFFMYVTKIGHENLLPRKVHFSLFSLFMHQFQIYSRFEQFIQWLLESGSTFEETSRKLPKI